MNPSTRRDAAPGSPGASAATRSGGSGASRGRILAWLGIVVLALYMTVGEGSGWYGVYSAVFRTFTLVALIVVLGTWAMVAWRLPDWRPRTALWPPIVAVLAAFVIASLASSQPRIAFEYTAYAILLTGLYLLFVRLLASAFFRRRLFGLVAILLVGICLWYLWTVAGIWATWWGLVGRLAIPPLRPNLDGLVWRSPNTVAIMAILLLPPVLAWYWNGAMRRAVVLGGLTLLVLTTVFLSGSRGAWLGLAVGVLVTAVGWLTVPGHLRLVGRTARRLPIRRGPAVAIAVLVVVGGLIAVPLVASRAGAGGEDLRSDLVATAVRMFQASPLTGEGPGTWVVNRIAFTQPTEIDYYIPHAHNVYAQALAEFGLLAALAGLAVAAWLVALIWNGIRDADATRRRFAWASLFSSVYFGVHQLVDVYVGLPCVLFAFAMPIAYLDMTSSRSLILSLPSSVVRTRTALGLLAAGTACAFVFLAWSESNALTAEDAVGSANAGDWVAAARSADAASAGDPDMPAYSLIEGLTALHAGQSSTGLNALMRAAKADDFPATWLDIAAVRVEAGDVPGAREALASALRVGGQQPAIAFAAGTVFQRIGDAASAASAFAQAITNGPTLASDPYFVLGAGSQFRADALAAALANWPPGAWDLALLAGDPDEAARRAATLTGPAHDRALQVIAAYDGDPSALNAIKAAAEASPLDLALVGWTARLARHAGDEPGATRYRQWANTIQPGSGDISQDLSVTDGTRSFAGFGGIDTNVFGLYTYRRPLPVDVLAPSLPHLVLR